MEYVLKVGSKNSLSIAKESNPNGVDIVSASIGDYQVILSEEDVSEMTNFLTGALYDIRAQENKLKTEVSWYKKFIRFFV